MSGFRVRFFKKALGGNGHEVDACQYSFETLANTRAEAEERAKKAFCEDHHLMNWTIHADRCQVQQAGLPSWIVVPTATRENNLPMLASSVLSTVPAVVRARLVIAAKSSWLTSISIEEALGGVCWGFLAAWLGQRVSG
jgi:hypothetical protein